LDDGDAAIPLASRVAKRTGWIGLARFRRDELGFIKGSFGTRISAVHRSVVNLTRLGLGDVTMLGSGEIGDDHLAMY
jgi:hypothetical protein